MFLVFLVGLVSCRRHRRSYHHHMSRNFKPGLSNVLKHPSETIITNWKNVGYENRDGTLILTNMVIKWIPSDNGMRVTLPIHGPIEVTINERKRQVKIHTIVGTDFVFTMSDGATCRAVLTTWKRRVMPQIVTPVQDRPRLGDDEDAYLSNNLLNGGRTYARHDIINNGDYTKHPTYPAKMLVPCKYEQLYERTAQFRKNRRSLLTVMQYSARRADFPSVVVRCSQPVLGHSDGDADALFSSFADGDTLVVDLRPRIAAIGNIFHGGSTESSGYHAPGKLATVYFGKIGNVDDVLNAYKAAAGGSHTKWKEVITRIVETLSRITNFLNGGTGRSVILHCTDGWDRTPQMSALVQIMFSPHYRTIDGFMTLIIREFTNRGHKFNKHYHPAGLAEKNPAPILPQFFEIVQMMVKSQPGEFEFGVDMLEWLAWHVYSQRFLEFRHGTDRDRSIEAAGDWESVMAAVKAMNFHVNDVVQGELGKQFVFRQLNALNTEHYVPWRAIVDKSTKFPGCRGDKV